jgi:hypothetical protein
MMVRDESIPQQLQYLSKVPLYSILLYSTTIYSKVPLYSILLYSTTICVL